MGPNYIEYLCKRKYVLYELGLILNRETHCINAPNYFTYRIRIHIHTIFCTWTFVWLHWAYPKSESNCRLCDIAKLYLQNTNMRHPGQLDVG